MDNQVYVNACEQISVQKPLCEDWINNAKCFDNKNYECHKLYKEYAKANHTIANHTYTHGWNRGLYRSTESFMDAVKKQENLVKSETGIITNIVRFPGGSGTPGKTKGAAMKEALYKAGYGWVDWTAQDGDGKGISSLDEGRTIFKKSIDQAIEVILFHDYDQKTTKLLPEFIKYLRDKNIRNFLIEGINDYHENLKKYREINFDYFSKNNNNRKKFYQKVIK